MYVYNCNFVCNFKLQDDSFDDSFIRRTDAAAIDAQYTGILFY